MYLGSGVQVGTCTWALAYRLVSMKERAAGLPVDARKVRILFKAGKETLFFYSTFVND